MNILIEAGVIISGILLFSFFLFFLVFLWAQILNLKDYLLIATRKANNIDEE